MIIELKIQLVVPNSIRNSPPLFNVFSFWSGRNVRTVITHEDEKVEFAGPSFLSKFLDISHSKTATIKKKNEEKRKMAESF